jgi:hypothetical protein
MTYFKLGYDGLVIFLTSIQEVPSSRFGREINIFFRSVPQSIHVNDGITRQIKPLPLPSLHTSQVSIMSTLYI